MLNINNQSRMKSQKLTKILAVVLLIAAVAGCKQKSGTSFELKGKLQGITDGRAILSPVKENNEEEMTGEGPKSDTVAIKNGEFVFTGDYPEPMQYTLFIEGKKYPKYFYIENAQMTITGHADTLYKATLTGGLVNDAEAKFQDESNKRFKKYKLDSLSKIMQSNPGDNIKKVWDATVEKLQKESDQYTMDYIKNNPGSYYSAVLVEQESYGLDAAGVEKLVKMLDPKLGEYAIVEDLVKLIENLKTTDVGVGSFTSEAPDMDYRVDNSFTGKAYGDIAYLASFPDDVLCGLKKDGKVCLFDAKGKLLSEFKTTLKSKPTALAIDRSNSNIYVLGTLNEIKELKQRGKTYKIETPTGVECLVYDAKGAELKKMELAGLKTATGAKVVNKKMLVADFNTRKVAIYDLGSGKMESSINNLRACCRILDFGVNSKNEILVANLGAFRVQAFDYSGKIKYAFGKRGQAINDFHGCCNPVNVASLSSGAIVTVEKDPTRIKIYSKSGARQISGIEELVKGCKYIPMTSDSKNNIYLASVQSGIVKCSPVQITQ
jgi:hypothetical protein